MISASIAENKMPAGLRPRDGQNVTSDDGGKIVVPALNRKNLAAAICNLKDRFRDGDHEQPHNC